MINYAALHYATVLPDIQILYALRKFSLPMFTKESWRIHKYAFKEPFPNTMVMKLGELYLNVIPNMERVGVVRAGLKDGVP